MTAVMEDAATVVARPDGLVVWAASRRDLRCVKVPRHPVRDAGGNQIDETSGQAVQFVNGILRYDRAGDVAIDQGQTIDAADLTAWLEKHRLFTGQTIKASELAAWRARDHISECLVRVLEDPPAVSNEENAALLRAAATGDTTALTAIRDAETAGWARPDFLANIETAFAAVEESGV